MTNPTFHIIGQVSNLDEILVQDNERSAENFKTLWEFPIFQLSNIKTISLYCPLPKNMPKIERPKIDNDIYELFNKFNFD